MQGGLMEEVKVAEVAVVLVLRGKGFGCVGVPWC